VEGNNSFKRRKGITGRDVFTYATIRRKGQKLDERKHESLHDYYMQMCNF